MLFNDDPHGQEGGTPMGPCSWLVQVPSGHPEPDCEADLWRVVECGAPAFSTDRGWHCDSGHSYVDMETRWREGWDYSD